MRWVVAPPAIHQDRQGVIYRNARAVVFTDSGESLGRDTHMFRERKYRSSPAATDPLCLAWCRLVRRPGCFCPPVCGVFMNWGEYCVGDTAVRRRRLWMETVWVVILHFSPRIIPHFITQSFTISFHSSSAL